MVLLMQKVHYKSNPASASIKASAVSKAASQDNRGIYVVYKNIYVYKSGPVSITEMHIWGVPTGDRRIWVLGWTSQRCLDGRTCWLNASHYWSMCLHSHAG